jgi:hypothetical protein
VLVSMLRDVIGPEETDTGLAAFINFTNIASAIKAIDAVKNREPYSGLRVSYGCVDIFCVF